MGTMDFQGKVIMSSSYGWWSKLPFTTPIIPKVQTKGDFEIWVYFIQGNGCDMCDAHERRHLGIKPLILQVET